MLTKRFLIFSKVVKRATFVRLYFAGNNVHSNLRTKRINVPNNFRLSSRNSTIPIYKEWNLTEDSQKKNARSCHTDYDDGAGEKSTSENSLAYAILLNSKLAPKTFAPHFEPTINLTDDEVAEILSKDWQNFSADEILHDFEKLSSRAKLKGERLEEAKHGRLLDALCDKMCDLDDEKFRSIFQCLSAWGRTLTANYPSYKMMWLRLDNECVRRLADWGTDEALLMCDHWYKIRLCKKAKFSMIVMKKLGKKPNNLSVGQFLHFMFIINTCRKPPINMYEVEYRFDQLFHEFTVNELGIIAMAFFKSQSRLRDAKLVSKFHVKMMEDITAVDDVTISAIMKITRYSTDLRNVNILQNLLKMLRPLIPQLSIPCISNIVHAAAYVQCYDGELMKSAIGRFQKNMDEARIKDIERLSWALNIFNYDSESPIYRTIVESLNDPKREQESSQYGKILPTTLSHLSTVGVFPIDLIKQCFDPEFLRRVYDNNVFKIGWDYITLENNLKIDAPEYDGPFLQPKIRDFLSTKFISSKFLPTQTVRPADRFIMEVAHVCKTVLGSETSIAIDQVLPQYVKPDIIICLDEKNNPQDPQAYLSKLADGTIKYSPSESNLKWIAIVLATQNQIVKGIDGYIGQIVCKVKQLEKIGYAPTVISVKKWEGLSSLEAKENYMRRKLCSPDDRIALAAGL